MMRDDFPQRVKTHLARRVNYLCSNPHCQAQTSGPALASDASNIIGVAAHITAASTGGPRYDSGLQQQHRRSADNGIWLCQVCARLVDRDPDRFTELMLREWKRKAEARALEQLGLRSSRLDSIPVIHSVHGKLERERNPRFGFSFVHPSVWDREDPTNRDGNTYRHPQDPRIEIRAWGGYAVVASDLRSWVDWTIENFQQEDGFRLVTDVISGRHLIDWEDRGQDRPVESRQQIEGYRLVYQAEEDGQPFTYVQTFLQLDETQISLRCRAPSASYGCYEDLFLVISKEIHILGVNSAPHARAHS
jgi:hypothetical protein